MLISCTPSIYTHERSDKSVREMTPIFKGRSNNFLDSIFFTMTHIVNVPYGKLETFWYPVLKLHLQSTYKKWRWLFFSLFGQIIIVERQFFVSTSNTFFSTILNKLNSTYDLSILSRIAIDRFKIKIFSVLLLNKQA